MKWQPSIACCLVIALILPSITLADPAETETANLSHWDQAERRKVLTEIQKDPSRFAAPLVILTISSLASTDANCGVRTLAAETLGILAPHGDISVSESHLKKALQDKIGSVRRAALETLCTRHSKMTVSKEEIAALLEDADRTVRIVAKGCAKN